MKIGSVLRGGPPRRKPIGGGVGDPRVPVIVDLNASAVEVPVMVNPQKVKAHTQLMVLDDMDLMKISEAERKKKLEEEHLQFNKKLSDPSISAPQPFSSVSYRPELDTSIECTPD